MSYKNDVNSNFYQIAEWDINFDITGVNVANLTVTNLTSLGSVSNISITGGVPGQFLQSTGGGSLTWSLVPGTSVSGNVGSALIADVANSAYSVSGSNVVGTVLSALNATNSINSAVAATANSVAGGNVVGTVGSASVAAVAAVANSIVGSNVVGIVANAFHSVVSDSSNSVSGSNVVGAVAVAALASSATVANSVAGGNVSGAVAIATLATTASTATTALSVLGSGVTGTVANATHALTSNTVVNAAQPNITSVGTLTGLISTGNIYANANLVTDNIVGRIGGVTIDASGVNQSITLNPSGTGVVNVSGSYIQNVLDPLNPQDAATKQYVDNIAQGLYVHETCLAGSIASIAGVYNNGVSGVGATFTPTVPLTSLDGVALVNGNRVLLKDQTNTFQNGIYVITLGGTVLTRASDSNQPADFAGGDFVLVQSGTINSGSGWIQTSTVITIGTDPIVYQQFSSAGSYTAGTGLNLVGSQFNISPTTVVSGTYGNGTHTASFTVNPQGQLTFVTNTPITPDASLLSGTTLSPTIVNSSLTSVGTLTSLNVTGTINLGGTLTAGAGVFSTLDGKLVDGDQPNITNIGTLSDLSVQGIANLGSVGNLIIEGGAIGTVLTSLNGPVQWSNSLTLVNANVTNTANIGNLKVTRSSNLGSAGNIYIGGGNLGEVLHTNGFGGLYWDEVLPNQAFQAGIEFVALTNGINQTFTHLDIGNFDDNTFASVYVNGVLMRVSGYDITGTVLTIFDYLNTGDEVTVGATLSGGLAEGTVRSISTATNDPSTLGFSLDTPGGVPLTTIGTITLNVPPASAFAGVINVRDYINVITVSPSQWSPIFDPVCKFNTIVSQSPISDITYDPVTGIFNLKANVNYRLALSLPNPGSGAAGSNYGYTLTARWVYAANNVPIFNDAIIQAAAVQISGIGSVPIPGFGELIFRPTTNVGVKVIGTVSGSMIVLNPSATIQQV